MGYPANQPTATSPPQCGQSAQLTRSLSSIAARSSSRTPADREVDEG